MFDRMVQQVSSYAGSIDGLILLVLVLSGFWFLLAEGMFFWLIWKFREKDGRPSEYITGKEKHLKRWISIPHVLILICDVFIIAASVNVWYDVKQHLPQADATIRITGQQWAWVFTHPGPDGELDTADDILTVDDLYVEVDKTYHYQLESRDVVHDFSVPVFRLKQDALPGRRITGWFHAQRTGTFDVQCAEICGIGHGVMAGRIHVQDAATMAQWVADNTPISAQ